MIFGNHCLQLSALAETGDMEKVKEYLLRADSKMPGIDFHFCDNQAVDSILGYYSDHAKQEGIPFLAQIDIPREFLPGMRWIYVWCSQTFWKTQ